MSFISSFQSFITDPIKQRVGAVVRGATTAFNKGNFGPLAALNQAAANGGAYKGTLQYPLDLDSPTGPHKSWIMFKILESTTDSSAQDGAFNLNLAKNSYTSASDVFNAGVSKVSEAVVGATGVNVLNALGLSSEQFITPTRRLRSTNLSIALYVPQTVQFNQNNNYSDTSLTAQLGMTLGAIQTGGEIQTGGTGAAGGAAEVAGALSGVDTNLVLFKTTGLVLNPQIEVIFQQTDMRTFQFDFVFAARSQEEQDQVRLIIEQFRNAAAPTLAGTQGRYMIPPSEFDIEFMFDQAAAPMIPKISTCVLTNVAVDYAPSGAYATFQDGQPISTRLTLQFKEVELIHKQRIQEGY